MKACSHNSNVARRCSVVIDAPTQSDVRAAAARLRGYVHTTPVLTCATLNEWTGRTVFLKCENFQKGGSFKVRGALNALLRLSPETRAHGVVAHSSGNFAQGLAIAARQLGVPATVVMPSNAPAVKMQATASYGANIVLCGPTLADRTEAVAAIVAQTGATEIPPSDHPDVIAGQGTCALELLAEVPDLDCIVAPLGGGGLLSGVAIAASPIPVVGAEPEGANDAYRSRNAGILLPHEEGAPQTICDGLKTILGQWTWPIVRDVVHSVVVVPDAHTLAALQLLLSRAKLVVEPSAAIALAALLPAHGVLPEAKRVGVVLSGGNLDFSLLPSKGFRDIA